MRGKYEGSFSIFVARVLAPGGHLRVSEYDIQSNIIGSQVFKTHINCWACRDTGLVSLDPSNDVTASHEWWFSTIESGDWIQLLKALHRRHRFLLPEANE